MQAIQGLLSDVLPALISQRNIVWASIDRSIDFLGLRLLTRYLKPKFKMPPPDAQSFGGNLPPEISHRLTKHFNLETIPRPSTVYPAESMISIMSRVFMGEASPINNLTAPNAGRQKP